MIYNDDEYSVVNGDESHLMYYGFPFGGVSVWLCQISTEAGMPLLGIVARITNQDGYVEAQEQATAIESAVNCFCMDMGTTVTCVRNNHPQYLAHAKLRTKTGLKDFYVIDNGSEPNNFLGVLDLLNKLYGDELTYWLERLYGRDFVLHDKEDLCIGLKNGWPFATNRKHHWEDNEMLTTPVAIVNLSKELKNKR